MSWLRFLGFDLGAVRPDGNTIRLCREKLMRAGAIDALFAAFDRRLRERGYTSPVAFEQKWLAQQISVAA